LFILAGVNFLIHPPHPEARRYSEYNLSSLPLPDVLPKAALASAAIVVFIESVATANAEVLFPPP
jgi:hypothetical protein